MSPTTCCTFAADTKPPGCSTASPSPTPPSRKCGTPIRSQRSRLSRSQSRQLWRRIRRPHLRSLQRCSAHRFRAQQRSRTRPQRWQLLPDQRRSQLRQPHRTLCLLRQRQRQPQRSRPASAGSASRTRCRQRRRRLRFIHLQRKSFQPAPPHDFRSPRLFPGSLRPQSQRRRKRIHPRQRLLSAISQHRLSRRRTRNRCRTHVFLGSHFQFPSTHHRFAVLPLQPWQLRQLA